MIMVGEEKTRYMVLFRVCGTMKHVQTTAEFGSHLFVSIEAFGDKIHC
jgi:hypothetical protein